MAQSILQITCQMENKIFEKSKKIKFSRSIFWAERIWTQRYAFQALIGLIES